MSYNSPDEAHFCPYTMADGEDMWNTLDCAMNFDTYVQQFEPEAVPCVQASLQVPYGSPIPSHTSPFNLPEDRSLWTDSGDHILDPTAWERLLPPQIPLDILQSIPSVAIGTDSPLDIVSATPSTNGGRMPSHSLSATSASADAVAPSSTHWHIAAPTATPPTVAVAPSSSTPMALEEITVPPEKPVLSSCDFGTTLTLGDALKKNLSSIPGGNTHRAFPLQDFPAKLAFWLAFGLGNDFRPRRKQVTVVTSKMGAIEQPSKARLAHLVAREMERYLKECELRKTLFPYSLDEIILCRIDLVSKGTIRPHLYIRSRRPRSVRSPSAATC